jgi:hypothetical protein
MKNNKIQLKTKRRYKKREKLFGFKKPTKTVSKIQSLLKTPMLLQTALAAETHLAEGLTLKLRFTVKVE